MIDIKTPKQREREERDRQLAKMFAELKRKHPTASNSRIISALAEERTLGVCSITGVRNALIRARAI